VLRDFVDPIDASAQGTLHTEVEEEKATAGMAAGRTPRPPRFARKPPVPLLGVFSQMPAKIVSRSAAIILPFSKRSLQLRIRVSQANQIPRHPNP
jgi:hypothetical protein